MVFSCSRALTVVVLCSHLWCSAASDCNLRVVGFQATYSHLNGNWLNTGGKSVLDPSSGKATWRITYNQQTSDLTLAYGGPESDMKGWVIYSGGIGSNTTVATCTTSECVAATDLSAMAAISWADAGGKESSSMNAVSVSCCPHKMNLCHKCDDAACKKHNTFASCLASSILTCCTPSGFINGEGCKCADKTYQCHPYNNVTEESVIAV